MANQPAPSANAIRLRIDETLLDYHARVMTFEEAKAVLLHCGLSDGEATKRLGPHDAEGWFDDPDYS